MKIAVITGASYGLGKAITEMLLGQDFKVYGVSRTDPKIENKNFVWIKADLLDENSFDSIGSSIYENKIDLLVNNAGTHIEELTLSATKENLDKIFGLNFFAPIFLTKSISKKIHGGMIINISSTSDRFVEVESGFYSASKAALQMFFETLSLENKAIKVFHLLPSYVDTPLQHKISDNRDFDWKLCTTPKENAELIKKLIDNEIKAESGSRIMILNNLTMDDTINSEKLYCYNVDTKEFKKIK